MARQYYIDLLSRMYVNKNKSKTAPHKAILLLAIIDMIERGELISSFIPINDSLSKNFKRVWTTNVSNSNCYEPRIAYPFFHMSSSPFWTLVKSSDYKGQKEYSSLKALQRDYSGAIIDEGLFQLMKDNKSREEIRSLLKSLYLDRKESPSIFVGLATIMLSLSSVC